MCRDHVLPAAKHRLLRDTGVHSEHHYRGDVVAVVLDQHRERPGAHQPRSADGRHHHLPVGQLQQNDAAGITAQAAR